MTDQTPPDECIAEALRLADEPTDARTVALVWKHQSEYGPRLILAHATTLHKLAVVQKALRRIAACEGETRTTLRNCALEALSKLGGDA